MNIFWPFAIFHYCNWGIDAASHRGPVAVHVRCIFPQWNAVWILIIKNELAPVHPYRIWTYKSKSIFVRSVMRSFNASNVRVRNGKQKMRANSVSAIIPRMRIRAREDASSVKCVMWSTKARIHGMIFRIFEGVIQRGPVSSLAEDYLLKCVVVCIGANIIPSDIASMFLSKWQQGDDFSRCFDVGEFSTIYHVNSGANIRLKGTRV